MTDCLEMSDFEPFSIVEESASTQLFDTFQDLASAKSADHDIQFQAALRKSFPECNCTAVPTNNCNLLAFARAGHATIELDLETDSYASWRGWIPALRAGQRGSLGENVFFAKYRYQWGKEAFIVYTVRYVQYVLKEVQSGEDQLSPSSPIDALLAAVGTWQSADQEIVWIFDGGWRRSKELFEQVEKAEWKNVILDEDMKKTLTDVSTTFFDSKEIYEDIGVPWKRGLIFYGPAGNGKTISIKALMHTLLKRDTPVPTLYVKSAPTTFAIRAVFTMARQLAPCLVVLEDIDTIVTANTRSYFFNELDGLENNDGILIVASTNHLDRLDPGITKRPSRFDRKYLFPFPSKHERVLYCEYWRHKLQNKQKVKIDFPEKLCPAIAAETHGFSFAYMQEAFVAALLAIVRDRNGSDAPSGDNNDDLDRYQLWVVIKEQIAILRGDVDGQTASPIERSEPEDLVHGAAYLPDELQYGQDMLSITDSPTLRELPSKKFPRINPAATLWQ